MGAWCYVRLVGSLFTSWDLLFKSWHMLNMNQESLIVDEDATSSKLREEDIIEEATEATGLIQKRLCGARLRSSTRFEKVRRLAFCAICYCGRAERPCY